MKKLLSWIDLRFPLSSFIRHQLTEYFVPNNLNFWYVFGAFALFVLVNQLLSGIWLTMFYTPTASEAFNSVEYIMRDVKGGWFLRYLHTTGASCFFIVIYCHMFRALLYGSHRKPRELLWLLGMLIYLLLLAEAFCGYLLPWGQMSYWGAEVITSLFGALPGVGPSLLMWLRGDYTVSDVTLHRFFALHVIAIPLCILAAVGLHLIGLHQVGSNNPEGVALPPRRTIPFHPYYTVKDFFALTIFLCFFAGIIFYAPDMGGYFLEAANYQKANALVTPDHIAPVWYMTPFYSILRAIPDKLLGIILMISAIFILCFIPWLDRAPVRSIRYRGFLYRFALGVFVFSFIALGYLGMHPVTEISQKLSRLFTFSYFAFFITLPWLSRWDHCHSPAEFHT